jgi:hypothetical protein
MKKLIFGIALLMLTAIAPLAASAQSSTTRPLRLVLDRRSTVDPVEIVKHLSRSCPHITLTTNRMQSDFMLHAGGWSGDYRFLIIAKGGDTIYATETALLSNAVKDVCKFLNTRTQQPY